MNQERQNDWQTISSGDSNNTTYSSVFFVFKTQKTWIFSDELHFYHRQRDVSCEVTLSVPADQPPHSTTSQRMSSSSSHDVVAQRRRRRTTSSSSLMLLLWLWRTQILETLYRPIQSWLSTIDKWQRLDVVLSNVSKLFAGWTLDRAFISNIGEAQVYQLSWFPYVL